MNVETGTDAAQFPEKDYMNGIFLAVQIQLIMKLCGDFRAKTAFSTTSCFYPLCVA
jgi:hypothetical protein